MAHPKHEREVKVITEELRRNPSVAAEDDAWLKIFHIQRGTIELQYHYAYNFIRNNSKIYTKPTLAENAGEIKYCPDKVLGYIANPVAKAPRPLDVYMELCEIMDCEERTLKNLRATEIDFNFFLQQRHKELKDPQLKVDLFDTWKNHAAKKGWMEQEARKVEVSEREKEAEIDLLAPYLARLLGSGHGSGEPLAARAAYHVREQCINDFKATLQQRQAIVQERFDKLIVEYRAKHLWYLANQYVLTPEKENEYFRSSAEMSFELNALEGRLSRSLDSSTKQFRLLIDHLDKHPLLIKYAPTKRPRIARADSRTSGTSGETSL